MKPLESVVGAGAVGSARAKLDGGGPVDHGQDSSERE